MLADLLGSSADRLVLPESKFKRHLIRRGSATEPPTKHALEDLARDPEFAVWGPACRTPEMMRGLALAGGFGEALTRILEAYRGASDKPEARVLIDHTPDNLVYLQALAGIFPNAKFIHIVRDPRAVAASVMPLSWGPNTARGAAALWLTKLATGLAGADGMPRERVMTLRYEDLVEHPEPSLRRACDFAGLDYSESMLDGGGFRPPSYTGTQHALVGRRPDPRRINAWEHKLDPRDIGIIDLMLIDAMAPFGYRPSPRGIQASALYVARTQLVDTLWTRRRNRRREHRRLATIQD